MWTFVAPTLNASGASTPPGINTVVLIQNHLTPADNVRTALLPPDRLRLTIQALLLFIA